MTQGKAVSRATAPGLGGRGDSVESAEIPAMNSGSFSPSPEKLNQPVVLGAGLYAMDALPAGPARSAMASCAADNRATGTRNGEQET